MPYLYRETLQNYRVMNRIVTEETRKYQQVMARNNGKPRERLINVAEQLIAQRAKRNSVVRDRGKPRPFLMNIGQDISPLEKEPSVFKSRRSPLGEYLLQVSKIYLQMDIEPEMRILRTYLHNKPPLHPRRPLHRTNERDMMDKQRMSSQPNKSVSVSNGEDSVIMVDQLWLYILDDSKLSPYTIVYTICSSWLKQTRHHYFFFSKRVGRERMAWALQRDSRPYKYQSGIR